MRARPYILEETNLKTVKETEYQVAILPWGATEAHNYHLPYGTDNYQAETIAAAASSWAWERGAKPLVLPGIRYGINSGQMDIPFCMNMNPLTQLAILEDVLQVLKVHHIDKLILFNGHGGNNFKSHIRELSMKYPDIFICAFNWWNSVKVEEFFNEPGDHAGELETSVMLELQPDLVLPLMEAGSGKEKNFKIDALRQGWVMAQRKWTSISEDTGVGDPSKASAEKGKALLDAVVPEIGRFIADLAEADLNNMYE